MEFTAVFPLVKRAVEFTGWLDRSNIAYEQKGRTVTFTAPDYEPIEFGDYLLTVGYYGSDIKRKATLNGVKAPISY